MKQWLMHIFNPAHVLCRLAEIWFWYYRWWVRYIFPEWEPPLTQQELIRLAKLKIEKRILEREIEGFRNRK